MPLVPGVRSTRRCWLETGGLLQCHTQRLGLAARCQLLSGAPPQLWLQRWNGWGMLESSAGRSHTLPRSFLFPVLSFSLPCK